MALSVGSTWGVASLAAAITFATGTVIVIFFVRRRHRRLMLQASGLSRGLSTYHRTHLSADATNYAHIPRPRTRLRRSAHVPYSAVSEGWANLPSQESVGRPPIAVLHEQQGREPELARLRRRRSLRATFSPHSFHVPKTRRQKKFEKAIPLHPVGRSPLSAITEISDPNTRDVSPTLGAIELPTEITPTTTPPRHVDALKGDRPISAQWPLHNDKRRSQDVLPPATGHDVNRRSGLMRMNSTGRNIGPSHVSLSQRSISMTSTMSVAPGDPLPPLPTLITTRYAQRSNSKVRSSMASTDTVSSSVLGTTKPSPSRDSHDRADFTVESPRVAFSPSLLREYEPRPGSWGPTAIAIGTPPGIKASRGLRVGATGIGSFRASMDNPMSRIPSASQAPSSDVYERLSNRTESLGTTMDTNGWHCGLSASGDSLSKSPSPPMQTPVARHRLPCHDERPTACHSMYEQHIGIGKISFNPDVLRDLSGNKTRPLPQLSQPRPASVGASNPFQWDQSVLSALRDANLSRSSSSQRRSHKRQSCVRISNLPLINVGRRGSALPQMAEQDEDPETPTKRSSNIPGLRLIQESDDEDIVSKAVPLEGLPPQSPFRNKPILNPTSPTRGATYSRASSRDLSSSPQPDSDVFTTNHYDPHRPDMFTGRSPDRNWPLSPTPLKSIKVNSTPSAALSTVSEPYDPESPVLPPPPPLSATLFHRKSTLHGPRNLPSSAASGRSSRTVSPSPLQRMSRNVASGTTAIKQRSGDDLRRSVMTLRRMNSDPHNGSPERVSKIYPNIAQEDVGSLGSVRNRSLSMVGATGSPSPMRKEGQMAPLPLVTETRVESRLSVESSAGVRHNNSRLGIGRSTSMVSTTGASIWEDASVRGDSPEPGLAAREDDDDKTSEAIATLGVDLEAGENFVRQERKDRARGSKLTSPQGNGLGLVGLDSRGWGTPASLYDGDGFLKE